MNNYQQDHRHMGVMPGPALSLSSSSSSPFHAQLGLRGLAEELGCASEQSSRDSEMSSSTHTTQPQQANKGPPQGKALKECCRKGFPKTNPHLGSHELTFSLCIPRPASTGTLISSLSLRFVEVSSPPFTHHAHFHTAAGGCS